MSPPPLRSLVHPVSRTFSLSLYGLPGRIRPGISLAYLLARASDTVADAPGDCTPARRELLALMQEKPDSISPGHPGFPSSATEAERRVFLAWPTLMQSLASHVDADLIHLVWSRILQGQSMDLERKFLQTEGVALSWADVKTYASHVAGSVGEFWTRVLLRHFPKCSSLATSTLEQLGHQYGIALQLVNICRDAGADRKLGRVYLSSEDHPKAMAAIKDGLKAGRQYTNSLKPARLFFATKMPLVLAEAMRPALQEKSEPGVKLDRKRVWFLVIRAAMEAVLARRH